MLPQRAKGARCGAKMQLLSPARDKSNARRDKYLAYLTPALQCEPSSSRSFPHNCKTFLPCLYIYAHARATETKNNRILPAESRVYDRISAQTTENRPPIARNVYTFPRILYLLKTFTHSFIGVVKNPATQVVSLRRHREFPITRKSCTFSSLLALSLSVCLEKSHLVAEEAPSAKCSSSSSSTPAALPRAIPYTART